MQPNTAPPDAGSDNCVYRKARPVALIRMVCQGLGPLMARDDTTPVASLRAKGAWVLLSADATNMLDVTENEELRANVSQEGCTGRQGHFWSRFWG